MRQEKQLTSLTRGLRHNQTDAEQHLWGCLRNHRLDGLKFKRQQPIGNYIVDFICVDSRWRLMQRYTTESSLRAPRFLRGVAIQFSRRSL